MGLLRQDLKTLPACAGPLFYCLMLIRKELAEENILHDSSSQRRAVQRAIYLSILFGCVACAIVVLDARFPGLSGINPPRGILFRAWEWLGKWIIRWDFGFALMLHWNWPTLATLARELETIPDPYALRRRIVRSYVFPPALILFLVFARKIELFCLFSSFASEEVLQSFWYSGWVRESLGEGGGWHDGLPWAVWATLVEFFLLIFVALGFASFITVVYCLALRRRGISFLFSVAIVLFLEWGLGLSLPTLGGWLGSAVQLDATRVAWSCAFASLAVWLSSQPLENAPGDQS